MRVSVLIENTSKNNLICEHGLSLLIEYNNRKILLDAGSTDNFISNADNMKIDLSDVNFAVLSHAHYDHSGGFCRFFEINKTAPLYARKEITNKYYSANGGMHEISVSEKIFDYQKRFILTDKSIKIDAETYLISHSTDNLNRIGEKSGLYKKDNSHVVFDDFIHEQSLVFDTEKGLVIFNSCSHGGCENIIREVKEFFGNKPIFAYIGGLHMKGRLNGVEICAFSDDEVKNLCDIIKEENISYVYTGHCTGLPGFHKIQKHLGNAALSFTTGMIFEL